MLSRAILAPIRVNIAWAVVIRRGAGFGPVARVLVGISGMTQPAKAQEPSMEEILASIRRIIADDESAKAPPAKPAPPPPAPPPAAAAPAPRPAAMPPPASVAPPPPAEPAPPPAPAHSQSMNQSDVDAMMEAAPAPAPAAPVNQAHHDILELTEQMTAPAEEEPPSFQTIDGQSDVVFTDAAPQPEPPRVVEEPPRTPEEPPRAYAPPPPAVDHSLLSASTSAAVDSAFNALAHTVLVQNARTLEDLVREMLRPMLKSWLDDNLPSMVERIVKAEIERVSRGRE
jgi:cell pole-organizing protein PopZ